MAKYVSTPLPDSFYSGLGSSSGGGGKSDVDAKTFFEQRIRPSDRSEVADEFKKLLVLEAQKLRKKGDRAGKSARVSKKFLTARERRELGLYRLPKVGLRYSQFLGLHHLWSSYMHQLLDLPRLEATGWAPGLLEDKKLQQMQIKIFRADFHGAKLQVSAALCPSQVGVEGICVMETKFTLQIISQDNRLRMIPKKGSTFTFLLGSFKIDLPGSGMESRPAERATKRPKLRLPLDF